MPVKAKEADILSFASEQNDQLMTAERAISAAIAKANEKKEQIEAELRRRLMRRMFVVSGPLESEELLRGGRFEQVLSDRYVRDRTFFVRNVFLENEAPDNEPLRFTPLVAATYKDAIDRKQRGGNVYFRLLKMESVEPATE